MEIDKTEQLYSSIKSLLLNARKQVLTTVNSVMTLTYYEIGRQIVEEEQNGKNRASYGKELLKNISKKLTVEFGKGFSERNLRLFRKFYQVYSVDEIWVIKKDQTPSKSPLKYICKIHANIHGLYHLYLKRETSKPLSLDKERGWGEFDV
jgi:hypothetical protein